MKHRCKKCKLEGNKGICDNEKCAGYDLGSKTPTQNDLGEKVHNITMDYLRKNKAIYTQEDVEKLLADARKEVIDNILMRLDLAKQDVEMAEDPKDPKVRIKYFERVLATLRKEPHVYAEYIIKWWQLPLLWVLYFFFGYKDTSDEDFVFYYVNIRGTLYFLKSEPK